ncbi:hypothetical protein P9687_00005, partial [Weizmannia sp. CD-2023]|nr:hypothetical protein [Weizmannia sp. CD-2023]
MKASKKDQKESRNPSELSFWRVQKDKRELESGRIVLLKGSKGQKKSWNSVELSFWRVQKDKRKLEFSRTVLLDASKRQKRARPGANCPFGGFKKTKESWNPVELSFWRVQKDKREPIRQKGRNRIKYEFQFPPSHVTRPSPKYKYFTILCTFNR